MTSKSSPSPLIVAIPARDEADRIAACLEALDGQDGAQFSDIVLLVNNSRDGTANVARRQRLRPGTNLHVVERELGAGQANAGFARRAAMRVAAGIADGAGYLFTTDADAVVDPDWLAANLASFQTGAEAVAGWVELDPIDWLKIPARLHADDARECSYDALCDQIHALIDPDPADPWPRHTQHSGASIALTASAYLRCGGVPAIACGEDRALIDALRRVDAPIRHAPEVHVTVSGRIEGRSAGGMADTIKRRLERPDRELDDRLEPAAICELRARCRALARHAFENPLADTRELSALLRLPATDVHRAFRSRYFGQAWESLTAASPALIRRRVEVSNLAMEMRAAEKIIDRLMMHAGRTSAVVALDPAMEIGD